MKTFIHKFLLLAVLPATLAGCGGAAKTDEPKKESVRVKVAEVEYTDFAQPILASGTLVSDKEARLSFKTGGIIAELLVDEGEAVSQGPAPRAPQPHRDRRPARTGAQRL
ncbi:MAG: hypothetical protein ACOJUL_13775 [Candidatus Pollutiaquabacter aromativorans]